MGLGDDERMKITPTSLRIALGVIDDEEKPELTEADIAPTEGLMSEVQLRTLKRHLQTSSQQCWAKQ